jgi:ATP synthase protein I
LRKARERHVKPERHSLHGQPHHALGMAFRIGVELVAALIVGVGIGYLIDRALGTMPAFLIVFFFLGAAAGAMNVYRAMARLGLVDGPSRRGQEPSKPERDGRSRDDGEG